MQTNNPATAPTYIIVVGASAGGLTALTELVGQLNPDMDIAVFIVLHLSNTGIGNYLVQRLQQFTSLKCRKATNNEKIEKGFIYVAPPRHHMILKNDSLILGDGPIENRWRPSIDVLFRSAAVNFTTRTIGIILTGLLDDGRAGMLAIKKCGGVCIVQDPNEAEYPDMPLAVLDSMETDYCTSLSDMGSAISKTISKPPQKTESIPDEIKLEANISANAAIGVDNVEPLGNHSIYSCPDCGGSLWEISDEKNPRYRCYVGHSYSESDLVLRQIENTETTLWVALRMMEERRNLHKKMERDSLKKGFSRMATEHLKKGEELQQHVDTLKGILFAMQNGNGD